MTQGDAGKKSNLAAFLEIPRTPLGLIVTILAGVTLLLVAGLIFLAVNVSNLGKDTAETMLETETTLTAIMETQEQAQPGWVESDFADVQPLGWGFLLVDLATEQTDEGTAVTGSIINSTALNHYDANFRVVLTDEYNGEFVLDTLKSGASDSFEMTIPDTGELSIPNDVRIIYLGSEVGYY